MNDSPSRRSPYVVFNPVKVTKFHRLRKLVTLSARQVGMGEPVWLETTEDDPGTGQAAKAIAEGAALVIAAGGDGTVRAVAAAMAHTNIPMAVLPFGTGNLLGRNLRVPTTTRKPSTSPLACSPTLTSAGHRCPTSKAPQTSPKAHSSQKYTKKNS